MNNTQLKRVVVVGGGFAGVAAIHEMLGLFKRYHNEQLIQITLIDKNTYHLFTPSLYEVAASEEPQKNIAIPFSEIFDHQIRCLPGTVDYIDKQRRIVELNKQEIPYDYLVLCVGSEPAYHHIPGLQEHSTPLKSLYDAIMIRNIIRQLSQSQKDLNQKIHVVIGGGGFAGTELAAELLFQDEIITQKKQENSLASHRFEINIIQGADRILKELHHRVSDAAQKRLHNPLVKFSFGGHIKEVTSTTVITDNGYSYPYDLLIWTGGVEANQLAAKSGFAVNKRGQVTVNAFLQAEENVFVAGDLAGFLDPKTQTPVPNVAQVAEEQGKTAGRNIFRQITGQSLQQYQFHHWGYVVPLKGKFAAVELKNWFHFDGYFGWVLQQIVFLWYLLHILPIHKAFYRWNKFEAELRQ